MAWSVLLGAAATAAATAFGSPAAADPPLPSVVPDSGARPVPAGGLTLPGFTTTPTPGATTPVVPSTVTGPLAARIYTAETEVATLGDQILELQQQRDKALADLTLAESNLRQMQAALTSAKAKADSAASDALKAAAGLPPGAFGSDLTELDALSRILQGDAVGPRTDEAAGEVTRAQIAEQNANSFYLAMKAAHQTLVDQVTGLEKTRQSKDTALLTLKRDNAAQLAVVERQQEAAEQRLGAGYISGENISGKAANPKAMTAVRYALAQLGDPYVWAAEGPNTFDCSGLMFAAYKSAGYTLPRVSRDQYDATKGMTVDRSALLPGDLLFFSSGSSWTSIHHVGMYLGNGRMVHAPTTGDVVKVSTVWWSRFYAATRVFPAVGSPTTSPTPKPTPSKIPTPTPTPSTTPSATPTPTPSATPTPTPTEPAPTTPPAAPTPTVEPTPTGTPAPNVTDTTPPVPPTTPSQPASAPATQQSSSPPPASSAEASGSASAGTTTSGS
jgi:cell wall-associated NlpC family hydrolase